MKGTKIASKNRQSPREVRVPVLFIVHLHTKRTAIARRSFALTQENRPLVLLYHIIPQIAIFTRIKRTARKPFFKRQNNVKYQNDIRILLYLSDSNVIQCYRTESIIKSKLELSDILC